VSRAGDGSGLRLQATSLEEEEFGDACSARLVEGFARHLMLAMDRWQERGFDSAGRDCVSRFERGAGLRSEIEDDNARRST
jgi:hypothetical protein